MKRLLPGRSCFVLFCGWVLLGGGACSDDAAQVAGRGGAGGASTATGGSGGVADGPGGTGAGDGGAVNTGGVGNTGGSAGGAGGSVGAGGQGGAPVCNPVVGLALPAEPCTTTSPCAQVLMGGAPIDTPTRVPVCSTTTAAQSRGYVAYDDGPPLSWLGPSAVTRYRCEFRPAGTSAASTRPLVIFFHGTGSDAHAVYNLTELRDKAVDYDLTGDPTRQGFILVSSQGRNLHWPTVDARDESHHDVLHRDLGVPSQNADIANTDRIVDALVAEGVVDPTRIYVVGWSNGGAFASMYAIARHATPTAGGNRVAAAAIYSSGDPFHMIAYDEQPSCQLNPYPTSSVPIQIVSRNCDINACSTEQHQAFIDDGETPAPGSSIDTWVETLLNTIGSDVTWTKLNGIGGATNTCTAAASCSYTTGALRHANWPDGLGLLGGANQDAEPVMLNFLASHPL